MYYLYVLTMYICLLFLPAYKSCTFVMGINSFIHDTDHGSDTDSVTDLEYKTWKDACAWRCRSALVNIPPGLVQNPPTGHIRHYGTDDNSVTDSVAECKTEVVNVPPGLVQNSSTDIMQNYETDDNSDTDSAAELEDYIGNDTCAWECQIALLSFNQNQPTGISYPALINCRQTEDMDCHVTRCVMIV